MSNGLDNLVKKQQEQQKKLTVYANNKDKLIIDIKNEQKPSILNRVTNKYGQYSRYIFNKSREIILMNRAFYVVDISLLHRPKELSYTYIIKQDSAEIALEDIVFQRIKSTYTPSDELSLRFVYLNISTC